MSTQTHLLLPRVFVLAVCSDDGPCPLPETLSVDVLVEEPLPGDATTLDRLELRWQESGELVASFSCEDRGYVSSGVRWFRCSCPREALETVEWPWYSIKVDLDMCSDLLEAGGAGDAPGNPVILEGPEEAGLVWARCLPGEPGGRVCVAGVDETGTRAYGVATCFSGEFEGFLPAHRGLRWAVYGGGGVTCRYCMCPATSGDYPLPIRVRYVFYKPNVEIPLEVDGLVFVVLVSPGSGPVDVIAGGASLF